MSRKLIFPALCLCFFLFWGNTAQCEEGESPAVQREDPVRALQKRVQAMEEELEFYKKEAEARTALMPTDKDQEQKDRTEDVLKASEDEAAKYVLLKQRTIEMRYSLSYTHSSYDRVSSELDIERETYFNFVNSLGLSYGLLPRLSINASIPFVFKYQKSGTSMQESDLGDASFGASWQLAREAEYQPAVLVSLGYTAPSGRSPYKVDIAKELSTGSGLHTFNVGLNISKVIDPVIAFGGFGLTYSLDVDGLNQLRYGTVLQEVKPGYGFSYAMGIGFALSYNTSVTFRFSASHAAATEFVVNGFLYESDESSSASFIIGSGWRITPKSSLNISLGYGLVGLEDYSLMVSIPFDFTL
ncbi:MAG: transporter [Deltaproteobacteria bacterium]|nr:transporter [Deltaproteobacteria bacterium]